jgi:tetratricopeptide (TPR) repeat protein
MGPALGVSIALKPKQAGSTVGPAGAPAAATVPVWALHIPPEAKKEYERGMEQLKAGRAEKSLKHLAAAARLYPEYAGAYSAMGTVSLKLGRQAQAMAAYQKALEIDLNLAEAAFGLGALLAAQQRYDEAERHLLRARLLSAQNWRVHFELGQLYWRQGEWEESEGSLRRAYNLHQDYPRLHLLLINVLALQEKYPQTLAAMNTFLALSRPLADHARDPACCHALRALGPPSRACYSLYCNRSRICLHKACFRRQAASYSRRPSPSLFWRS